MQSVKIIVRVFLVGFIIWALGLTNVNSQIYDADALRFSISLDKERYLVNEAITLTMVLKNVSAQKVYAPSLDPSDNQLTIYVVSISGDTLEGSYISGNIPGCKYPTLDSEEKNISFINLLGPIYSIGTITEDAIFSRLIPVGKYTVQAKLRHRFQGQDKNIFSNKLGFKVENPSKKTLKIGRLLINAWWKKCVKKKDYKGGASDFLEIINEYPKSPYVDGAYYHLAYLFRHEVKNGYKGETFDSLAKRYLKNYPNSSLVVRFMKGLRPGPGKPAERKKFYEDIIKKYPNTKASMYAENRLDKWRRGKIWVDEPIPED